MKEIGAVGRRKREIRKSGESISKIMKTAKKMIEKGAFDRKSGDG